MVKLNALQLREVVLLISGSESIVKNGCREDGSHASGTVEEPVVLPSDGI